MNRRGQLIKTIRKLATILLILSVCGIGRFGIAEEASDLGSEADGSKIERIDVFWITPDKPANDGIDDHLYISTSDNRPLTMQFQMEVALSGQYDYAPGDITIRFPAQIWHKRGSDSGYGDMSYSIPEAPDTRQDFNWTRIGDDIVITNAKVIGATSKAMFQFTIEDLIPVDLQDMSISDKLSAECFVTTHEGNTIHLKSSDITAQVDTSERVTGAHKSGRLYEEAPSSLPANLLENLPGGAQAKDDYIYVQWANYVYHQGNQPFSLTVADDVTGDQYDAYRMVKNDDGSTEKQLITDAVMLGMVGGDAPENNRVEAEILHDTYHSDTSGSYDHNRYIWTAYKKDAFYVPNANEPQVTYYMHNDSTWTLTEADPYVGENADLNKPEDKQQVTTVTAGSTVTYSPVKWKRPTGHFSVNKYTIGKPYKDHLYGYALNRLQNGENVQIPFELETIARGYPWTVSPAVPHDNEKALEEADQKYYGYLGWRQYTEDFETFYLPLSDEIPLTTEDYEISSMRIAAPSTYRYGKRSDGTWDYIYDSNQPKPDLEIYYQLNNDGNWIHGGTASWGETGRGRMTLVAHNDASVQTVGGREVLSFPPNTSRTRHEYVSNVCGGKTLEHTDLAEVVWSVYDTITLKASPRVMQAVEQLFDQTDTPSSKFKNDDRMNVDVWLGQPYETKEALGSWDFDYSEATLAGAAYGVAPSKSVRFDRRKDNDVGNQRVILHYQARVAEQSNLTERKDYTDAVASGVIPKETKGIWYDLLPPGVYPDLDTVRLRNADKITSIYTVPDFKNTGRILMVVECDLTPTPSTVYGATWGDQPTLTFDAYYPWEAILEHGRENVMNYVAFESLSENLPHDTLGTIKGQQGEADVPEQKYTERKNNLTPQMPADIVAALTDLDPETDENRFLYAKAGTSLTINLEALAGIAKLVQDDLKGVWTQGLDGQEQVNVYEGHNYTYRLRVTSGPNTITKDIVIYDTVENYDIPDPKDEVVHDATKIEDYNDREEKKNWYGDWSERDDWHGGQWRGRLLQIDLSEFIKRGVDVKLWVSDNWNLQFKDAPEDYNSEQKRILFSSDAYAIDDPAERAIYGWQQMTPDSKGIWTAPEGMDVTAVAIDARYKKDGTPFELDEFEKITAYLHMKAPDDGTTDEELQENYHAKGAYAHKADGTETSENPTIDWEAALDPENNMHAFNNTRLKARIQIKGTDGDGASSDQMFRNDYTRVGIVPRILTVEKQWKDEDDYDAIRPDHVVVHLRRKVMGGTWEDLGRSATLDDSNDWKAVFQQIDVVDEKNRPYQYSFTEDPVPGYTDSVSRDKDNESHFIVTNTHEKDTVSVEGQKIWSGENGDTSLRPESIRVKLYRDGEYQRTLTVRPDSSGDWHYSFGDLIKNKRGGEPYVYTVEEEYVPKYVVAYDGYKVIDNTLKPYGDLSVEKVIENATPAASDKDFTFTFSAFGEVTQEMIDEARHEQQEADPTAAFVPPEPVPLDAAYRYTIKEGETEIKSGEIMSGESFKLKGGQKFTVYDLPSEATYKLEEVPAAGYTQTSAQNAEGAIRAGRTQEAVFTNTYHAQGNAQLRAIKTLTGHKLNRNQFRFDVTDKTEGSETYGEIIRSAGNDVPTSTQQDESSGVITSQASVAFGQIRYTEADAGKTFTYEITEQNTGKDGYTYSTEVKTVTVKVEDLTGDGNLTVTVTPDLGSDDAYNFNNTYKAEGEISFKAWKVLEIYDLEKDQFEFELYKYDPNTKDKVGAPLQTAKNNEDGTINFAPIKFTQDDVNVAPNNPNIYWYLLREKRGSDPAVVYSNKEYIIKITPYDNNDGTISFSQDDQQVEREWTEETCPDCEGSGMLTSSDAPVPIDEAATGEEGQEVWLYDTRRSPNNNGIEGNTPKAVIYVPNSALCTICKGKCYNGNSTCSSCSGTGLQVGARLDITSSDITPGIFDASLVFEQLVFTDVASHAQGKSSGGAADYCMRVGRVVNGSIVSTENPGGSRAFRAYVPRNRIGVTGPVTGGIHECENCNGTGIVLVEGNITVTGETTGPVFVNGYHDGNLKLTKNITNGNPSQKFTFKVKLVGLGTGSFDLERKGDGDNSGAGTDSGASGGETTPDISGILPVYHATAAEIAGTKAYAVLNKETGEFIFFRTKQNEAMDPWGNSFNMSGATTANSNRRKETDGFIYYDNFDNAPYGYSSSYRPQWSTNTYDQKLIKTVTMRDPVQLKTIAHFFRDCSNIETIDLRLVDVLQGGKFSLFYTFYGLNKLKELNLGNMDLRYCYDLDLLVQNCSSLETINMGHLNTARVFISNYWNFPFKGTKITRITIGDQSKFIEKYNGSIIYPQPISGYEDKWVNVDTNESLNSHDLFTQGNHGGTWELDPKYYNITFDANGGSGSMQSQRVNTHRDFTTGYNFYRFGYDFTGFMDNYGHFYAVDENGKVKIPSNTYSNTSSTTDVQVTLTAQWTPVDNTATMENDTLTVSLYGGESVTIHNIPAGTAYEIWEEVPDGWILVSKVNDSGVIVPLETAESVFTDEYAPNKATASMTASKMMDAKLTGGYTFGLYKVNNGTETLIDTKESSVGGIASFDIITYTLDDVGTHEYVIREIVENPDPTIQYDTHAERVRVVVYDDGRGNLDATTGYLDRNGVFVNSTKPGDLKLSKTIEKASPKAAEQEFTFKVSFLDRFEQPTKLLEGGTTEKTTVTALNSNGTEATLDIVDNSVTVTLRGGETVTLKDIPAGIHYKVEELNIPVGWAKTGESGTTGEIRSTETSSAAFTNTYTAAGRVYLEVVKELLGSAPKADSFTFELYAEQDWDEDENVPKAGAKPLDTQKNAAPDMREEIADPNSSERGATIPNPDYGKAIAHFNAVNFTEADVGKAFHYYIREVPGTDSQIVYTKETRKVTVTVTDETGEGRLTATPDYSETAKPTLTNSYKPGSLEVSKHLLKSTAETKDKVFTFTVRLEDASGTPLTGTFRTIKERNEERETGTANAENGKLVFTLRDGESILISGLPDGSDYRIEEAEETGFILSGKTGEEGTIVANETQHAVFRNTYDATGELKLSVGKRLLIGATQEETKLEAAQFSFTLRNQDGQALQQKYNDERGRAVFDPIELTLDDIGTSSYTITENNYGVDGINYDDSKIRADVTVKDDGQGQLKAEVEYTRIIPDRNGGDPAEEKIPEDEVEFINRKVKNGKCAIRVEKTLEGQKLKARRFKFELVDERGNVIATRYNNAAGQTIFDPDSIPALRFDTIDMEGKKEKQFNFVVREVNDGLKGMQYAEPVPICLTVTEDESAVLKVNGQENPVLKAEFHNAYQAETEIVLEAEKQYLGGTLKEGDFLFELLEGGKVIAAASNDAQGKVRFNLKYTIRDVDPDTHRGEKRYVMRESVPEKRGNIRYDTHEESIIVSLVDNENGEMMASSNREGETIKFINEWRKPNRYYFSFRKVWKDAPAEGLQFTLYNSDGTVHVHGFNKTVLNDREWLFEAWLDKPDDYYVIEEVPDGFSAAYDNAGNHADETDRCYNGGTIVNSRVPDTGDRSHAGLWAAVLTSSAALLVLLVRKKR